MNLKNILKTIRMNESTISTILGVLVVVVVGILIVNYFRSRGTAEPNISVPGEQVVKVEGENQEEITKPFTGSLPTTHKVQKGENLWKIAEHYYGSGYNWVDIAKENGLRQPNGLAVGQELNIPNAESKTGTIANLPSTGISDPEITIQGDKYTVEKGDSLWTIAVKAYGDGYQWVKIAKENNITSPNIIHPGNELSLPR